MRTIAPSRSSVPASSLPAGTRPFRAGDEVPILDAMIAAKARGELEGVSRDELRHSAERLAAEPWLTVVAEDEGRLAGWVVPFHDDLFVDLPYRRRGHGRRLLEAGIALAAHLGMPGLRLWVPPYPGPEGFARACDLRYRASLWRLRLDNGVPVAAPSFGDDVAVRCLEPGTDEPAFVALVNEVFLDHPSPLVLDVEEAHRVHTRPDFDPSTILLVAPEDDRGRLVGFCRVARWTDDDGSTTGEVKILGVRRAARGCGLGRSLLRWGVDDLRRRGVDRIYLSVEGENASALRLYEDAGFERHLEWPHWAPAGA
jgi:mycothiol synthase